MNGPACGHEGPAAPARLCAHLIAAVPAEGGVTWKRLLSGKGFDGDLACTQCALLPGAERALERVCERCVTVIERDLDYFYGFLGSPEIKERPEVIPTAVGPVRLPEELHDPVDIQPLESESTSAWLVLARSGDLVRFDLDPPTATVLASFPEALAPERLPEPSFPPEVRDHDDSREAEARSRAPRALHVSPDGRFAAVVAIHGSTGLVVDLERGSGTMRLDRGDHHLWASRFSCAFFEWGGRTLLVHTTDWNRLDVSDPANGELLTERRPHELDYFHAGLLVSPDGQWIADDGWVWHPFGAPRTWSLDAWLGGNVWESEDGPTVRRLTGRAYYWGKPMCWVTNRTLAITGIGHDDDHIIPGVRLFDVGPGTEQLAFAGPEGDLFHDGRLFSASPGGLVAWDPSTGERLGEVPGFTPSRHHRRARELIELRGDRVLRWPIPPAG